MDKAVNAARGETAAHLGLKRAAFVWAQAQGFIAAALEVSLPQCRYRADVAAYKPGRNGRECTAILECKQARPDLRRDNCCTEATRARLESVFRRRLVLEKHLRIHYPYLRASDSLFPEYDSHDFAATGHHGYARVIREFTSLQNRLHDCTKLETLARYRCANLFYLVVPEKHFRSRGGPGGMGRVG